MCFTVSRPYIYSSNLDERDRIAKHYSTLPNQGQHQPRHSSPYTAYCRLPYAFRGTCTSVCVCVNKKKKKKKKRAPFVDIMNRYRLFLFLKNFYHLLSYLRRLFIYFGGGLLYGIIIELLQFYIFTHRFNWNGIFLFIDEMSTHVHPILLPNSNKLQRI